MDDFRKAMLLDPNRANTYGNLTLALLRLDRLKEAQATLAEASRRGFRTGYSLLLSYWLGILNHDQQATEVAVTQCSESSEGCGSVFTEVANHQAAAGHFKQARGSSKSAEKLLRAAGDKEGVARILIWWAFQESQAGFVARARTLSHEAGMMSHDKVVLTTRALVAAQTGDYARGSKLAAQLDEQYPRGTFVQKFWLPMIRGEMELRQGRGARAVVLLSAAEQLDPAVADGFSISPMQPTFLLGQAWLAAGDGVKASEVFRRLTEHPGMLLNSQLGALALLGQARSYALENRPAEAAKAYQQFLSTWKDADPDIPLLQQARAEAGRLQKPGGGPPSTH